MAYQVLNIEGSVLETLQSEEQVQELFDNDTINAFWFDEGLLDTFKNSNIDGKDIIRVIKKLEE